MLKHNRRRSLPRTNSGDKTLFNSKLSEIYDEDWVTSIETVDYTPDNAVWELIDLEKGLSRFTKSDSLASWAEEYSNMTVRLVWW